MLILVLISFYPGFSLIRLSKYLFIRSFRYGADPNTNVKGTRPLHEALEGGHIGTVLQLLRHGSDPLLYDYSGNMPIDLAKESEDDKLLNFFSAILSDLHGKPAPRWNVSHDRSFALPQTSELDLPRLKAAKADSDDDSDDDDDAMEFEFEVSSQPLPPQFALPQHPDEKFVLATDLKRFTSLDLTKLTGKLNTIKMARDEFVKSAYCCLLGASVSVDAGTKNDHVVLVKADSHLKKLLAVDDPKLFHNLNATNTKKKSSS